MWFDSHAHLQDAQFEGAFPKLVEELAEQGLRRVLLPASDLDDARLAVKIALEHAGLFVAVGVHPHEAKSWTAGHAEALRQLKESANEEAFARGRLPVVVALGEVGLDYHYDFSPRETQKAVFREQLRLAKELNLPLVLHEREAFQDFFEILEEALRAGLIEAEGFACHCFSGSLESARLLWQRGAYLGFDGPITFKNARKAAEILAVLPKDRLLLETDSPYLTPEPFRGKRNSPVNLPLIARAAASFMNCSEAEMECLSWENANRFFRLPADRGEWLGGRPHE